MVICHSQDQCPAEKLHRTRTKVAYNRKARGISVSGPETRLDISNRRQVQPEVMLWGRRFSAIDLGHGAGSLTNNVREATVETFHDLSLSHGSHIVSASSKILMRTVSRSTLVVNRSSGSKIRSREIASLGISTSPAFVAFLHPSQAPSFPNLEPGPVHRNPVLFFGWLIGQKVLHQCAQRLS